MARAAFAYNSVAHSSVIDLLSALLLSKLIASVASSLENNLPPTEIICYTDSQVALFWIQGMSKEWK